MFRGFKEWIKFRVQNNYTLYWVYKKLIKGQGKLLVNRDTDIVIEGFGGSGNTFALRAFMHPQILPYDVTHHTHTTSQLHYAVRSEIPIILLSRNPTDAVISLVSRGLVGNRKHDMSAERIRLEAKILLERYKKYHNCIKGYKDQMVVADFDDAMSDFGSVVQKINKRYNREFLLFNNNEENLAYIWKRQKIAKSGTKRAVDKDFVEKILSESEVLPLIDECAELYRYFIKSNVVDNLHKG